MLSPMPTNGTQAIDCALTRGRSAKHADTTAAAITRRIGTPFRSDPLSRKGRGLRRIIAAKRPNPVAARHAWRIPMLGRSGSPEEKRAYRSFVSVGRIADDVQGLLLLIAWVTTATLAFTTTFDVSAALFFNVVLFGVGAFARLLVPRIVRRVAPPHVQ